MKEINLIQAKKKSLSEIFQSLDIKFAFVNKKFEEVSTPAKCRDFLGDCIFSKKSKKGVDIYAFQYDYKTSPFDDCRFSLTFPNKESQEYFLIHLPVLHEKEQEAGVKLSKVYKTQVKNVLVIEGSNYWVSDIWKVSLYTFYLKMISYPDIAQLESPENGYIKKLTKEKEAVMLSKIKTRKIVKPNDYYEAHNQFGFVSALGYNTKLNKLIFG